jgi:hypothetical protein
MQRAARSDGVAVAGADQGQPARLRVVGAQRLLEHRAAQVVGQRSTLANGKNTGFLQRLSTIAAQSPAANMSGSLTVCRLSRTWMKPLPSSARPVSRNHGAPPACVTQTISSAASVSPLGGAQLPAGHGANFGVAVDDDRALDEHLLESAPHPRIVRRQNLALGGKKVEAQFVGVAPEQAEFLAQAILHGQRQLDATGAGANNSDGRRPGVPANALQQGQPALVETRIGLTGMACSAAPSTWLTAGIEPMLIDSRS